ncbi:MAG: S-layer homology domain-containing protein [Oscillospiraceae bacterium]
MKRFLSLVLTLALALSLLSAVPAQAAENSAWDGTVDISWYDPDQSEFYLSTPAQLAGLAALVNGMVDPECPKVIGDQNYLQSIRVDDYMLVGAGGGNVSDTVYTSTVDFAYKTVYLTADMDMGGRCVNGVWSGPNWTPIGGKFPMKPSEIKGDCLTLDTRFNGVLDGQGHTITNLYCDRYAQKGFPYSMAVGVVGFLGGISDTVAEYNSVIEFSDGWQPAVRNLVLGSGSILGRRMVGGIVGRIGETNTGVIVENCANFAQVKSTDAKGVGGIVGSAWDSGGVIRNCYNAGYITTTYSSPAGGIVGTNEGMDIYNCYNIGIIDTNGQSRGRGIGSHDTGTYTVDNCYFLSGCGDDADNPGYYKGVSKKISVNVTEMTAEELKSEETLAKLNANGVTFVADVNNINNGYPVLWFQNGLTGGDCTITLAQSSGGTISLTGGATVSFGQTVTLDYQADTGYTLEYFTVNGTPIASNFFIATEDMTVSAVFTKLNKVQVTIPESRDYYVAVARQGWKMTDGEMVWVDHELLRSGDTLVQGNILTVLTYGYEDATPADPDLEYIDAYICTLPGTEKNADGTYTVTGTEDVNISVDRSTQTKSWINWADTSWYVSGGRQTTYTLTTPEELAGLAYLVNKSGVTFAGLTIRLGNDISLDNTDGTVGIRTWTPIGSSLNRSFQGTFDGQDYSIYNMTVQATSSYAALFGCCVDAVIQNVSVYGAVSGTAKASYAAGVAAYMKGGSLQNCLNYAAVSAQGTHAGGIAALIRDGARVENCFNYGAVTAESGLGGIVGVADSGEDAISACANFGSVTSTGNNTYGTGGIVGRLAGTVSRCANYGAVGGSDRYTGGIAGYATTKNKSTIELSANHAAVRSDNSMGTASLGGVAGYAQFLRLTDVKNDGAVSAGSSFQSGNVGQICGREGTVTAQDTAGAQIPDYTPQAAKTFPNENKSSYTVTFRADGNVVAVVEYAPGDSSVAEPEVPGKDGYTGYWDNYRLGNKDITVRAVYRQVLVRPGDTITEDGTYHITWFSSGTIDIAEGVSAVLDGSNGGSEGFEALCIRVGENASLTLRDTVLNGEITLLSFAGNNTLTLSGANELNSRTDAQDNSQPTVRVSGDLVIDGDGSLYVSAGIRNAAVYVDKPGSTVELKGGTLAIYKEDLLGFEGGAFYANGSQVIVSGGTLKGHTVSDNVAVLSADRVTLTDGALLLQAERSPAAVQGEVTASGGTIAAFGHTGNSAAFSQSYAGREAIPGYSGSAVFQDFLPFTDVYVTDSYYDAVETCYKRGYFQGTSDATFEPELSMTRAMFVTVLYRLAGQPQVDGTTPFTDLTQDWYQDAVIWAVGQGITTGTSDTTFSPDEPVSREQAAVFLYRYAQMNGDSLPGQADRTVSHGELSSWAQAEALWALSGGLFDGAKAPMENPQDYAPRSLLATALANYIDLVQ